MKEKIPAGTPIGDIDAPLSWLISHTAKFAGAILVRVYAGEGFVLVLNGRPVAFYFRMGTTELKGAQAQEFLAAQESLNASLRRYTHEELQQALSIVSGEGIPVDRQPEIAHPGKPSEVSPGPVPEISVSERAAGVGEGEEVTVPATGSAEVTLDTMLDDIIGHAGVVAVTFLKEGNLLISRGSVSLDGLVQPGEDLLISAAEMMVLLTAGPLVRITVGVQGNSLTIAPFRDGYLFVLTGPGVNIGQARKLVSEIGLADKGR